jgi:hypothetical protein
MAPVSTISSKARANRKSPTRTLEGAPQIRWAATLRGIDHVVVQQGGSVDELDGGGQLPAGVPFPAAQPRGGDGEQRAQALAAGLDQVIGERRDHADRALHARHNKGVNARHIGGGELG